MQLRECVEKRHSYRAGFLDKPVSKELLRDLIHLAYQAPSGCNLQSTQFVGVDDPTTLASIAKIYGHSWAESAKAAVIMFADTSLALPNKGPSRYREDFAAAAEHLLLGVTEAGLASCWIQGQIEGEPAHQIAELINIPDDFSVLGYFPLGYPEKDVSSPSKKSFNERCFYNSYGNSF